MKQSMTIEQWNRQLDRELEKLCGMNMDCLPDYDTWNAWNDGETPQHTARKVIKAAQFF